MNDKFIKYVEVNYADSKSDLFAIFMENKFAMQNGFSSMVNQHSWMFLKSYEELRKKIIKSESIQSMIHLGARAFEELNGEVVQTTSFVIRKTKIDNYKGVYVRLVEYGSSLEKEKNIKNNINKFLAVQENYSRIKGYPFAYWISSTVLDSFTDNEDLSSIAEIVSGMTTGNNDIYLKKWNELNINQISFNKNNIHKINLNETKWIPYNKGGEQRKWYGNNEYVVNWSESSNFNRAKTTMQHLYLQECITWSDISGRTFAARHCNHGFMFDVKGSCAFSNNKNLMYLLGLFNSKVAPIYIDALNPTTTTQVGDLKRIPKKIGNMEKMNNIDLFARMNAKISKNDWDNFEVSWDFKIHPLIMLSDKGEQHNLSDIFRIWETECEEAFEQLKHNEEELNRIFIDIYGLQDELTPEVEDKDITIRKADRERDIKSFISYAVGCMFGRYFIDAEGLIYAGSIVDSGKCVVDSNGEKKKLTSFDEILSKIVNEVRKNESAKLSTVDSVAEGNGFSGENIYCDKDFSEGRNICTDKSDTQSSGFHTLEHSRRAITQVHSRISEFLVNCPRFKSGSGDANTNCPAFKLCESTRSGSDTETNRRNCENVIYNKEQTKITTHCSLLTTYYKPHCPLSTIHYLPDSDNIIPITEDEYFEDDIVSRFIEFVRTVYGEETLEENLDFIADSISRKASETSRQAIRRYFIKDFYKDHLKVYKKRPIYWMFDSGKNNGFKALLYMHRYNEQTIAKVRTDYLHTLQRKYESEIERQQLIVDSGEYSAKDRTAAKKKIAKIAKQIEECREYDQVVAHLANEKISIDLDDGVKVNYAKFQGVKVINSKEKEVKMDLLAKI